MDRMNLLEKTYKYHLEQLGRSDTNKALEVSFWMDRGLDGTFWLLNNCVVGNTFWQEAVTDLIGTLANATYVFHALVDCLDNKQTDKQLRLIWLQALTVVGSATLEARLPLFKPLLTRLLNSDDADIRMAAVKLAVKLSMDVKVELLSKQLETEQNESVWLLLDTALKC